MLHELGHCVMYNNKTHNDMKKVNNELTSQLWAIKKAKELGLKKEYDWSIKWFEDWGKFDWNSKNRRYILARKKFIKTNMSY